jgi:hypothetical protein
MEMTNPWNEIEIPCIGQTNAKRAEIDHLYDFFWGKGTAGEHLFIFQCEKSISCKERAPKLNGIDIVEYTPENGNKKNIVISIKDREHIEIFYVLCCNILSATKAATDSKAALAILYRRTWRWHQLLKKGYSGILSKESQKGLLGELIFLKNILFDMFSFTESLSFWEGPLGAPKDFCLGTNAIEVKTKRGTSQPYVTISSEHQLDRVGLDNLYLYVISITPGIENQVTSFTLTDVVNEILDLLNKNNPDDGEEFQRKLMEIGYLHGDDYSEFIWQFLDDEYYEVNSDFPFISNTSLPEGVSQVTYKLDLNVCNDFIIDKLDVKNIIRG